MQVASMRSRTSKDDINHCGYEDVNESGFQISENFEDTFHEIEDMLDGRKGWGDYIDDGSQQKPEEIERSETDKLGFRDCEIRSGDDEVLESSETDELTAKLEWFSVSIQREIKNAFTEYIQRDSIEAKHSVAKFMTQTLGT